MNIMWLIERWWLLIVIFLILLMSFFLGCEQPKVSKQISTTKTKLVAAQKTIHAMATTQKVLVPVDKQLMESINDLDVLSRKIIKNNDNIIKLEGERDKYKKLWNDSWFGGRTHRLFWTIIIGSTLSVIGILVVDGFLGIPLTAVEGVLLALLSGIGRIFSWLWGKIRGK
jgi:hypothetical protein